MFYTEEDFPEWGIEPHPGKHKQNGSVLPKEVNSICLTNIILCPPFSSHLTLYYYNPVNNSADNVISQKKKSSKEEIVPGGNRAVLTLANGSIIVLDSVHSGTIASQNGSNILKLNSGKLVYHPKVRTDRIMRDSKSSKTQYNTLSTPHGGQFQVKLPDGTKVWLNSLSSITFPTSFTDKGRSVTLTGEAYFEVAENEDRPFKVEAGKVQIEVLGTHFNVNAYSDEPSLKATLLEGSIKVTDGNARAVLQPGQQAVMTKDKNESIDVVSVNTAGVVAWKNDCFSFYRTDIYEIMRQISRWYDVEVRFEDSLHVFLNGNISREVNASEVFKMLEMTGELEFTIKGKKVIVKKSGNIGTVPGAFSSF